MADPTVLEILPGETLTFPIDYGSRLPAGVAIQSAEISAKNLFNGADAPDVLGSDADVTGGVVSFVATGVDLGDRYEVTLQLTFDDATPSVIRETFLLIGVRNRSR